jgi:hypothetical protein
MFADSPFDQQESDQESDDDFFQPKSKKSSTSSQAAFDIDSTKSRHGSDASKWTPDVRSHIIF